MNGQQVGYEECVATSGKLIALYRQPPEAFAGLDADERKVLDTARLLKTESKASTGKYRDPSASQISSLLGGGFTQEKVQVMLRKIIARGLLQIYKKPDREKEPTMNTHIDTTTPALEAPTHAIHGGGRDAANMFQPVFDAYMNMLRASAQSGDKVTYQYAVKQLADDTFTGMYFNAQRKAAAA
ncbi:hypothetical protein [Bifidobacterium apri]|uniref:Uncharacterized protein n=1 Tax=Bifidobacterium apri TaxID=1769423 RepID=A0A6A2VG24_9BIFI|nr:hypothetical protein [Bifidobacterium apri]KAB8291888.1 hypothetical protein DSM100238_1828 [Bifidobacterium apri]